MTEICWQCQKKISLCILTPRCSHRGYVHSGGGSHYCFPLDFGDHRVAEPEWMKIDKVLVPPEHRKMMNVINAAFGSDYTTGLNLHQAIEKVCNDLVETRKRCEQISHQQ